VAPNSCCDERICWTLGMVAGPPMGAACGSWDAMVWFIGVTIVLSTDPAMNCAFPCGGEFSDSNHHITSLK